jgi:hypothetical protein
MGQFLLLCPNTVLNHIYGKNERLSKRKCNP